MYLLGKHINSLNEADIFRLVENNIRESKTLDFKREFKIDDDKEKNKNRQDFIADVAAFYNAVGGCIVYGIEEQQDENGKGNGAAGSFYSQHLGNHDKLEQKIQDTIRSSTDPSIVNVAVKFLNVDAFEIIIIGVPRRVGLPVMVTYNNINKYFKRNNVSKYPVGTTELNEMFLQSQSIRQAAQRFIEGRLRNGFATLPLMNSPTAGSVFMHMIPANFQEDRIIDISVLDDGKSNEQFFPIAPSKNLHSYEYSKQFNYEGYSNQFIHSSIGNQYSRTQFFRNGIIEFFSLDFYRTEDHGSQKYVAGIDLFFETISCTFRAINIWKQFDLEPPFFVSLYINAPSSKLTTFHGHYIGDLATSEIHLPLVYFDSYDMTNGEVYNRLRPCFNILWQTAGKSVSPTMEEFFERLQRHGL